MIKVAGPEDKGIYSGKEVDDVYLAGSADSGNQDVKKLKIRRSKTRLRRIPT